VLDALEEAQREAASACAARDSARSELETVVESRTNQDVDLMRMRHEYETDEILVVSCECACVCVCVRACVLVLYLFKYVLLTSRGKHRKRC
jgi:hypothetical protein